MFADNRDNRETVITSVYYCTTKISNRYYPNYRAEIYRAEARRTASNVLQSFWFFLQSLFKYIVALLSGLLLQIEPNSVCVSPTGTVFIHCLGLWRTTIDNKDATATSRGALWSMWPTPTFLRWPQCLQKDPTTQAWSSSGGGGTCSTLTTSD